MHLQYSTQWDSLAHVGSRFDANGDGIAESVYYNGYRAGEDIQGPTDAKDAGVPQPGDQRSTSNATALGIQNMAESCVQGRGVMLDFHAHFGNKREIVGYDTLMRVMEQDKVVVEPGDMVCLHTGFAQMLMDMKGKPDLHTLENSCAALNGRDKKLLNWITDSQLVVLMADNYAVEHYPAVDHVGCCATLPLHEHCLFKLGVHLGEMFYLTPLAKWLREHGRNRFLLTAPPLRLPGAVGSPSTAVATV
jgi:kynurenine formamidase